MKIKSFILTVAMAMLLGSGSGTASADSTFTPPSVGSMSTGGSVPLPPVCNASTQKLHWNGSAWQCLAVGHATSANTASSVTGQAKGSFVSKAGSMQQCPSGTTRVLTTTNSLNSNQNVYLCFKN